MSRKRQSSNPLDAMLPTGLFRHGRQYRARLGPRDPWVYFGSDAVTAAASYIAWRRDGPSDTVAWWLNLYAGTICARRVKAGEIKQRTADDYARDIGPLKDGLGHIPLRALTAQHIEAYKDVRSAQTRHCHQEMGCLQAAMAHAAKEGRIQANPCKGVRKPKAVRRERLITDDEYLAVYGVAIPSVQLAMRLGIRTLALPADLLAMGPRNILRLPDGSRALRYQRGKTGRWIEMALVGDLAELVDAHLSAAVVRPTFLHKRDGSAYTVDGIGAMFRRYCAEGKANIDDFGLRDLRAKGATDMYRRGTPLEHLRNLLGHASVRTTEIYIKGLLPILVRPNETPIVASVK